MGLLVYFMAIRYILRQFGIFYGHLVYYTAIWYMLCSDIFTFWYITSKKSGNPAATSQPNKNILVGENYKRLFAIV
jgi:hypothetical protein